MAKMFSCELWGISRNNFLTEYVRMTASNDLFWKKKQCFPVNFAKFFRTPFLQKNSGRLQNTLTNCHSQQIQVHIITLLKRYSNSLCQVGNNTPPKCNIYTYKINVTKKFAIGAVWPQLRIWSQQTHEVDTTQLFSWFEVTTSGD